ncbi:hypothetical protein A6770_15055 [Nostoc minutum NIES-26]|uniref:Uncharacterized protein n=1 Tax=Nostoc minutum NIES-26 TaxID=1844469 RepID=A0A367RNR7_9NOSO|nr:hypothetical protein A6770_15055 [Nostoc minutum NIES-26]
MKPSVSIYCFTICCSALLSFIPKSASAITITLGPVSVSELENLFTNNGFEKPSITLNETETTFDLSILGKPVNGTGSFDTDFVSDFWRGKLSFSQTDPIFASDTLSAGLSIFHQAGIDRPHSGDALKGVIYTKAITINSNAAGTTSKLLSSSFNGKVKHPSEHFDEYSGILSANVAANTVLGNIYRTGLLS